MNVIMVTGLGNNRRQMWPIVRWWKHAKIVVTVFDPKWENEEKFEVKLKRLLKLVDKETKVNPIALVGISAGGSLALNAFLERKKKVNRVVTVCSQLRHSHLTKNTTLQRSEAFKLSVEMVEKQIKSLSEFERSKILNVRSLLTDELVPTDTSIVSGSKKIEIPTEAHVITIVTALTLFSKRIIQFIKEDQ